MMRSSEIKGLTVFSIADGKEIGKVKDLLINADKKAVDYLIIEIPNWYFGSHVIAFNMVEGIGKDAVVIESDNIVKELNEEPASIKLIERGIKLIGNRVLTKKGLIIGKISEYYINIETGQITGCELIDNDNTSKGIIPTSVTLTFGKDALVVRNEVDNHLLGNINEYSEEQHLVSPLTKQVTDDVIEERPSRPIDDEDNMIDALQKSKESINDTSNHVEPVNLFEQRQREYLLGRVVKNNIRDMDGNIIIKQDEVITKEIIDKVTLAGKFAELILDV